MQHTPHDAEPATEAGILRELHPLLKVLLDSGVPSVADITSSGLVVTIGPNTKPLTDDQRDIYESALQAALSNPLAIATLIETDTSVTLRITGS